ncbi:MAG: DNA methyltransferase [Neisseria zoodegmatis]|uniref:DNA methyltransferase n=1 Tax=Neisseria zoodegmatis TaxID=326523 RepID=UPI0026E9C116|nr:DNA methyltransferase [Neisseria zoodegmatis]MDO5068889.1 DNA methyltransferase [Neisseria zoodegmatis]
MSEYNLEWLVEWTFKERRKSLAAHKIHRYPAVFIPELAEKIIKTFSKEGDLVLDIFSGSGTTLLEAMKLKRYSKGIELNPLGILISEVKTQYIDANSLSQGIEQWKNVFLNQKFPEHQINNKEFWFHETTNNSVKDAIGAIEIIKDKKVQNFLKICLSEIIREVSYCVHSGFKLHKDKEKVNNQLSFDKFKLLAKLEPIIQRNFAAIIELKKINDEQFFPEIYFHDSRVKLEQIKNGSVDLILTSPPYGDSKTTVAYGQFSTFSSELLQLNNLYNKKIRQLDNDLLGGQTKGINIVKPNEKSITIRNIQELFLGRIALTQSTTEQKKIKDRLKDIISFYDDLDKCIQNGANYLKKDGFFILITASRIVHNTKLHTDNIIAELGINYGLKLKNIYYRDIHNKRMPLRVSATNIIGETTSTMTEESIIVLQKT